MSGALPANPNHRLKVWTTPESKKKVDQILEKVSPKALLDDQILEQTEQELENVSKEHPFSPEQLQEILFRAPLTIAQLKLFIIKLKQENLIDSELASLFCAALKEFDLAREQNTITKEKKEKLELTLSLVKQKLTKLVSNKQIEPLLAKPLILMLPVINAYIKTINIS